MRSLSSLYQDPRGVRKRPGDGGGPVSVASPSARAVLAPGLSCPCPCPAGEQHRHRLLGARGRALAVGILVQHVLDGLLFLAAVHVRARLELREPERLGERRVPAPDERRFVNGAAFKLDRFWRDAAVLQRAAQCCREAVAEPDERTEPEDEGQAGTLLRSRPPASCPPELPPSFRSAPVVRDSPCVRRPSFAEGPYNAEEHITVTIAPSSIPGPATPVPTRIPFRKQGPIELVGRRNCSEKRGKRRNPPAKSRRNCDLESGPCREFCVWDAGREQQSGPDATSGLRPRRPGGAATARAPCRHAALRPRRCARRWPRRGRRARPGPRRRSAP